MNSKEYCKGHTIEYLVVKAVVEHVRVLRVRIAKNYLLQLHWAV